MSVETKVEVVITARNEAGSVLNQLAEQTRGMVSRSVSQARRLTTQFRSGMGGAISFVTKSLFSMKSAAVTALAGWGLEKLVSGFIETGSSMDQLTTSLDTLTKGQGKATFAALNDWALKMPVNTQKAIESYTMMRAMGLQPAIEDMTTLVDTAAAIGGRDMQGALEGISRALGQIKTKGRVSTEELLQMAERGVPVFEILREKLNLTNDEIGRIGELGLDADRAIAALMEGMNERFGGQSDKLSKKWAGLTETIKAYWAEFQRLVMESGVMAYLEDRLAGVVAWLDELKATGELGEMAKKVGEQVIEILKNVEKRISSVVNWVRGVIEDGTLSMWAESLGSILRLAGQVASAVNMIGAGLGIAAARAYTWTEDQDKKYGLGDYANSSTTNNTQNVGGITVNLPSGTPAASGEDWRTITRDYILPEMEAAGS